MKTSTKCVHAGMEPDPSTGAVSPPVYMTSTYHQEKLGVHKGFEYSRSANPSRQRLEQAIASLEGVSHGLAFSSGLATEDAILHLLEPGDTLLSIYDVYGGTYRLMENFASKRGIKAIYFTLEELAASIDSLPAARMIWIETPTNPLLKILDIRALAEAAAKMDAILVVDNTFATPVQQSPAALGARIVVHSATKYLGGHSDVVLGALATDDDALAERLAFTQNAVGAVPGPMDCYLVHRGIKTLKLRMDAHGRGAAEVARVLKDAPGVIRLLYPGLPDHPGHAIAASQMTGFGGMVTLELDGGLPAARAFVESLELIILAESLGGVESLACHPATMTHASVPPDIRSKIGITDGLVRLSIGIEDPEDLVEDVLRAAAQANSKRL